MPTPASADLPPAYLALLWSSLLAGTFDDDGLADPFNDDGSPSGGATTAKTAGDGGRRADVTSSSDPPPLEVLARGIAAAEDALAPLSARKEVVWATAPLHAAAPATSSPSSGARAPTTRSKAKGAPPASSPTRFAVVAIHGWSASPRELQPLDERIAAGLGAHLCVTRARPRFAPPPLRPSVVDRFRSRTRAVASLDLFRRAAPRGDLPPSRLRPTPPSLIVSLPRSDPPRAVRVGGVGAGARSYRHRLSGHGLLPTERGAAAMVHDATAPNLLRDATTAFAVGRALAGGDHLAPPDDGAAPAPSVVLVASSTGGALATWLARQPWARPHIAALVVVSPACVDEPSCFVCCISSLPSPARRPNDGNVNHFPPGGVMGHQPHRTRGENVCHGASNHTGRAAENEVRVSHARAQGTPVAWSSQKEAVVVAPRGTRSIPSRSATCFSPRGARCRRAP